MDVIISVGGRFHAYQLARVVHKAGYLKKFITTRFYSGHAQELNRNQVRSMTWLHYVSKIIQKTPGLNRIIHHGWFKDNLFDILSQRYLETCDIFHVWNNYGLYTMPVARKLGAKIVVERGSAHTLTQLAILTEEYAKYGLEYSPIPQQIVAKQLAEFEQADYIMIPSDFVYQSMIEHEVQAKKLIQIPYGVDLDRFKVPQRELNEGQFRILFVGMLSLQKGVQYLLEAVKQLALPNMELILIGSIRENFKPILARYEGLFTYLGWVDHFELSRHYAQASVFTFPSLQEGSAMVTYEAMACGLPMIVSINTGAMVRNGMDGFVIPIRDVEVLKEKILYFYHNREKAVEMGESARDHIQQFTWKRYGRQVLAAYEHIIGDGDLSQWQRY